jgi:RNA-binding protein YlmH
MSGMAIQPEEAAWLRRVEDWIRRVQDRGMWVLTDFLTPRERIIAEEAARQSGIVAAAWGGHEEAERQRALLMPWSWGPVEDDFEIDILRVTAGDGSVLQHGAILGAVLGTGIDRRRIGDIAVDGSVAWIAVCRGTSGFLLGELHRVGRTPVRVELAEDASRHWPGPVYTPLEVTVASLRADAVLAQACRLSRGKAQEAIAAGRVSLNHVLLERPDRLLSQGDLVSVRGFGRIRIDEILGATRKDRMRVRVGVLKSG